MTELKNRNDADVIIQAAGKTDSLYSCGGFNAPTLASGLLIATIVFFW